MDCYSCLTSHTDHRASLVMRSLAGLWIKDLAPRRHITADESINENAILQWMKPRVALYSCDTLLEMRLASLLNVIVAEGPHPPLMEKTRGVQEPCSTSSTLLS